MPYSIIIGVMYVCVLTNFIISDVILGIKDGIFVSCVSDVVCFGVV